MQHLNGRACGSCTACCKTLEVTELKKPPWKQCTHCINGRGCGIYPTRPDSCKEFRCDWLKGFGDECDRPDRTGVILDFVVVSGGLPGGVLQMWETRKGTLHGFFAMETTLMVLSHGIWVMHIPLRGRRKKLFVPRGLVIPEDILPELKINNIEESRL